MAKKLSPFDMAAHLDSPKAIAEYLDQVLADNDTDELVRAIGHIAKALEEYLRKREGSQVTEQLNALYAARQEPVDPALATAQLKAIGH